MDELDKPPSIAKAKIEDLQEILRTPDNAKDPALDPYRDMMHAAHQSSNGSAHLIAALSETVGHIAIVLSQEKLREPQRLQEAVESVHAGLCPVTPLIGHSPDGRPIYPWPTREEVIGFVKDLRSVEIHEKPLRRPDAKAKSSFRVSLKEGVSASGPVAWMLGAIVAVFVYGYIQKRSFSKDVDDKVMALMSQQLRIAAQSADDHELKAEEAAARSESVKDAFNCK